MHRAIEVADEFTIYLKMYFFGTFAFTPTLMASLKSHPMFYIAYVPRKLGHARVPYGLQNLCLFSICYLAKEPIYPHLHLRLEVSSHSYSMPHQRVHLHCNPLFPRPRIGNATYSALLILLEFASIFRFENLSLGTEVRCTTVYSIPFYYLIQTIYESQ
jgi:hypothetical protein